MFKSKLKGVQHLAREIFGELGRVNFIPQNGVTNVMKMHSDLVGAATVQLALYQAHFRRAPKHFVFSSGFTTTPLRHTHSLPMDPVPANLFVDYAGTLAQFAGHQGQVGFCHRPVAELGR